ncbi:MAG: hypothetical protein ACYDAC_08105 [Candidatus Dormibacteria bacterium]
MSRVVAAHGGERGLLRGCCLLVLLLVVALVAAGFTATRALAAPDLGPDPGGTSHGSTEALIAAALAGSAATQLAAGPHAVVTLSEIDLTVLARARNPDPARLRNPQARIRNGRVVLSATTDVGPFAATLVVDVTLSFTTVDGQVQVTATPTSYAIGQLGIPAFVATRAAPNTASTLNLTQLFTGNPPLQALAQSMECVAVQSDGVHVGFHRPGVAPDATRCTAPAA